MGTGSALRPAPPALPALPVPLTSLVGREQEIAAVCDLLRRDTVRLLTLMGPPGVGKTRLALAAAAAAGDDFADGVWFVPLAAVTDSDLVLPAIAATLDLPGSTRETPWDRLVGYLAERRALVVLDNLEQVVGAGPEIAALLAACPQLSVLTTSRAALRLSAEHQALVPPLALPPAGEALPADCLAQFAAVRLFVERAQMVVPGFTLGEQDASPVAEICRRLDGLPLAIELAAVRSKLFSPPALLARLGHLLPALAGGPRDAPARQQTLRAALDWSHDLLAPEEQILFRRLSVFSGGWTLAAAEAICGCTAAAAEAGQGGAPRLDVTAGVVSLLDKSLLLSDERAGEPRPRLLQSVQEYAREQLEASGEEEDVRRRHATYYLALAPATRPLSPLTNRAVRAGIHELEVDLGNYRGAMAWFLAQGDGESALRMALVLYPLWEEQGRLHEGAGWIECALATGSPAADLVRAEGMRLLGMLVGGQGDFTRANQLHQECLRIYREHRDEAHIAAMLTALGSRARSMTDYATARQYLAESLAILTRLGHVAEVARCLAWLGAAARGERDYAQARSYLARSLALTRQIARGAFLQDEAAGEAVAPFRCLETDLWCLWNLGAVACDEGDLAAARGYWREQLTLNPAWESYSLGATLLQVTRVALLTSQPERAARLLASADALRASSRYPWAPVDHVDRHAAQAALCSSLPEHTLQAAQNEGAAMTLEEAIRYAFETLDAPAVDCGTPPTLAASKAARRQTARTPRQPLSARQREVAALVAQGLTNRQIAEALTITERTAENHVEHILSKLGFHSRSQIGAWAAQQGLVPALTD